ncbi:PLDc N-terminal domain-containing protein [Curtobacterium sp. AB451]|uniref:PLDc N-terminal domain-containing protein n=1 Tax=unclassified Curtobacterium TaxID=257496 RepID=UPI00034B3162|nr:PLDc N-terminal domain-containing protein [Curtobacterium sp. B18]
MIRLWLIVVVAAVAFTVYAAIDCATMPRERVRSLSRGVWVLLVIVLPVLGGVLWFLLGRAPATRPGGGSGYRGPEDDPDFLGGPSGPDQHRTDKDQDDETLRDLEQQFRERERRADRDRRDDDGRADR